MDMYYLLYYIHVFEDLYIPVCLRHFVFCPVVRLSFHKAQNMISHSIVFQCYILYNTFIWTVGIVLVWVTCSSGGVFTGAIVAYLEIFVIVAERVAPNVVGRGSYVCRQSTTSCR